MEFIERKANRVGLVLLEDIRGIGSRHALGGAQPGADGSASTSRRRFSGDEYIGRNPEAYRYSHFCEL
jgi:hypothetical protein